MYGAGYGAQKRRYIGNALRRFLRALFVSQDTEAYTLSFTKVSKVKATETSAVDLSDSFTLDIPSAALVSTDADSFTMETDTL